MDETLLTIRDVAELPAALAGQADHLRDLLPLWAIRAEDGRWIVMPAARHTSLLVCPRGRRAVDAALVAATAAATAAAAPAGAAVPPLSVMHFAVGAMRLAQVFDGASWVWALGVAEAAALAAGSALFGEMLPRGIRADFPWANDAAAFAGDWSGTGTVIYLPLPPDRPIANGRAGWDIATGEVRLSVDHLGAGPLMPVPAGAPKRVEYMRALPHTCCCVDCQNAIWMSRAGWTDDACARLAAAAEGLPCAVEPFVDLAPCTACDPPCRGLASKPGVRITLGSTALDYVRLTVPEAAQAALGPWKRLMADPVVVALPGDARPADNANNADAADAGAEGDYQ